MQPGDANEGPGRDDPGIDPGIDLGAVVGHRAARRALAAAARQGRLLGTALLLVGPEGTGRSLLARELGRALLCAREGPALPCGLCGACGRALRGRHADLLALAPAEGKASIGIEAAQDALGELALAPVEGRARALLIDPAGALTEEAQNTLLKGLEEPPPRAAVVLVAASEDEVLPTIASRCRVVRVGELSAADTREVLLAAGLSEAEAAARARWAAGRPGLALSAEAQALAALADEALLALASGDAWQDPMATADRLKAVVDEGGADAGLKRARALGLLAALERALRDALVEGQLGAADGGPGAGGALERLSGADPARLATLARAPARRLTRALERVVALEAQAQGNMNGALVLEGLVLELGQALGPLGPGAHAPASGGGGRRGRG